MKILNPKQTIVALDFDSYTEADLVIRHLDPNKFRLKVGKQLFSSEGPKVLEKINKKGFEIFLDLKLHDIPNTVYKALKNLLNHNVWMTNIHLLGGVEMIKAASEAKNDSKSNTLLVGVTVLTSLSQNNLDNLGLKISISKLVETLSMAARENSIDGVVCSVSEVLNLKKNIGKDFITVTPGIRINEKRSDQSRVATIEEAVTNDSDFIVLGREITSSKDVPQMIKKIESYII